MNKGNLIFLFVFLFVLSSSFILAQPPFEPQVSSINNLNIVFPKNFYYKVNEPFSFEFHAVNSSGIILTQTQYSCFIHIYDNKNDHLQVQTLSNAAAPNIYDKIINVSSTIYQNKGHYFYNVFCNSTEGQGGFVSEGFEINLTGTETSDNYLPIIMAMALVSFLLLYSSFKMKNNNLDLIKAFMFPIGILFAFLTLLIPLMITLNPVDVSALNPVMDGLFSVSLLLLVAFGYFYGIHLLNNVFKRK